VIIDCNKELKAARKEKLRRRRIRRAKRKAAKLSNLSKAKIALMTPIETFIGGGRKPDINSKEAFYKSWDWRTLRMEAIKIHGPRCQCCGAGRDDVDIGGNPVRIVVDHIEPLSRRWDLRLVLSNLQILCDECNMGKGAWDQTDWRNDPKNKSK